MEERMTKFENAGDMLEKQKRKCDKMEQELNNSEIHPAGISYSDKVKTTPVETTETETVIEVQTEFKCHRCP